MGIKTTLDVAGNRADINLRNWNNRAVKHDPQAASGLASSQVVRTTARIVALGAAIALVIYAVTDDISTVGAAVAWVVILSAIAALTFGPGAKPKKGR